MSQKEQINSYYLPVILVLLIGILVIGCKQEGDVQNQMEPERLMAELNDPTRFVSTDMVADWLINQDPSIRLVDVRSAAAYQAYALPGSLNIPMEDLMNEENQQLFSSPGLKFIFYSNDNILAEQAWLLNRRNNLLSYIMKGGLNEWAATILNPKKPCNNSDKDAWKNYTFRKAANTYFAGGAVEIEPESYKAQKTAVVRPVRKKVIKVKPKPASIEEDEEEEGC